MNRKKLLYFMFFIILISPGVCFSDENTNTIALKLIGTVVNTSGNNMAIIEDKSCVTRIVKEKEFIPDAGIIKKIETNYIIVASNQKEFNIRIDNDSQIDRDCRTDLHEPAFVQDEVNVQDETNQHRNHETNTNEEPLDLGTLEQQVYEANNILTGSQVQPYMEEDGFVGFVLAEIYDGGLFQRLGLTSDDVITEINAIKKNQPFEMLQSLTTLDYSGPPVNFSIIRENKKISFFIDDEEEINRIRSILSKHHQQISGR